MVIQIFNLKVLSFCYKSHKVQTLRYCEFSDQLDQFGNFHLQKLRIDLIDPIDSIDPKIHDTKL
jgi:hypothetical protein